MVKEERKKRNGGGGGRRGEEEVGLTGHKTAALHPHHSPQTVGDK